MKSRTFLSLAIGLVGVLLSAQAFFAEASYDPHLDAQMTLKRIAVAEQANHNEHNAYADLGRMVAAGERLPELNLVIPENSKYEFYIEEWKGVVTIRAMANLDSDSTIDTWAMSLGDRSIPVCLTNDLDN